MSTLPYHPQPITASLQITSHLSWQRCHGGCHGEEHCLPPVIIPPQLSLPLFLPSYPSLYSSPVIPPLLPPVYIWTGRRGETAAGWTGEWQGRVGSGKERERSLRPMEESVYWKLGKKKRERERGGGEVSDEGRERLCGRGEGTAGKLPRHITESE